MMDWSNPMAKAKPPESFNVTLRRVRDRTGWTREKLAYNVGVSVSTLLNWERGPITPRLDQIKRMAEIMGVTLEELIPG
jgi:transcriptional regulator with XRE-family HTH domain